MLSDILSAVFLLSIAVAFACPSFSTVLVIEALPPQPDLLLILSPSLCPAPSQRTDGSNKLRSLFSQTVEEAKGTLKSKGVCVSDPFPYPSRSVAWKLTPKAVPLILTPLLQ